MKLIALSIGALLLAQTPVKPLLNVQMGLWEVTTTTEMGGGEARVPAAIRGTMGKPSVVKSCMSPEKFVANGAPVTTPGTTCHQNIQTNTAKVLENTMICTGARPSKSVSRTEALSPTAFTGTVTSTTTAGSREMTLTMKLTGKWLGAECGDVK